LKKHKKTVHDNPYELWSILRLNDEYRKAVDDFQKESKKIIKPYNLAPNISPHPGTYQLYNLFLYTAAAEAKKEAAKDDKRYFPEDQDKLEKHFNLIHGFQNLFLENSSTPTLNSLKEAMNNNDDRDEALEIYYKKSVPEFGGPPVDPEFKPLKNFLEKFGDIVSFPIAPRWEIPSIQVMKTFWQMYPVQVKSASTMVRHQTTREINITIRVNLLYHDDVLARPLYEKMISAVKEQIAKERKGVKESYKIGLGSRWIKLPRYLAIYLEKYKPVWPWPTFIQEIDEKKLVTVVKRQGKILGHAKIGEKFTNIEKSKDRDLDRDKKQQKGRDLTGPMEELIEIFNRHHTK